MLCVTTSNESASSIDGILGLGRKGTSYTGEHYIDQLFAGGKISQAQFSISFDLTTSNSYMDLGPPDTSLYLTGATPTWIKMIGTQNPYWQAVVDGFYFGNNKSKKYTTDQVLGIMDSGWSTIAGPKAEVDFIKKTITDKMTTTTDNQGNIYFSCSKYLSSLPSLFIRWGDYWLEVQGKDYAINTSGDTCLLFISENESFWALGMTVMRGYYVTYDVTNDRVGIVP